jgi:hypothetical protein
MGMIALVCWVIALLCFALAAGNVVAPPRPHPGWLGAFFIALAHILSRPGISP